MNHTKSTGLTLTGEITMHWSKAEWYTYEREVGRKISSKFKMLFDTLPVFLLNCSHTNQNLEGPDKM